MKGLSCANMPRNTKTYRGKMARRAREERGFEPQSALQNGSQDELMEEIGDDLADFNGDVTTYIENLPNEILNAVTSLTIASGDSVGTLRLVSKRFRACAQSHLIKKLQEKVRQPQKQPQIRQTRRRRTSDQYYLVRLH
jgi:hypothetical protein